MTVDELLKYVNLMHASGLGDKEILVFDNNGEQYLGRVSSWSIEDTDGSTHACALWIDTE